jgi:ankyrin repeat protein
MLASEFGKPEVVEVILNYYEKVDMDVKNEYEYTAVILAAESGNIECVDLLIGNGADLNLSNKFGKTALIMAAENGHYDIVLSLSASGNADLNQV